MTATFWTGSSLSFTNGSKTVTVNTGPSLDSVKANSSLTAGNYNEPVEVKSVSGNTITLYNNWPGSTGTTSATIKPSAAAAASAGVAAQQLITEIQSLVGSASATATANSFVKRDSSGRMKASAPIANDDVVNKGYFQSPSALTGAGIFHEGNSANSLNYGIGGQAKYLDSSDDINDISEGGIYRWDTSVPANSPEGIPYCIMFVGSTNGLPVQKIIVRNATFVREWTRTKSAGVWNEVELFHTGNTNFNILKGNNAGDSIAQGYMATDTVARFLIPINQNQELFNSITVQGTFAVRQDNGVLTSNITAANIGLHAGTSYKIARIEVTGLSGTTGKNVLLEIGDASSQIILNK